MSPLLFALPLVLAFEIWQLVISERYLGVDQIERETDPRELGLGGATALFWIAGILVSWLWMFALLVDRTSRLPALAMILITVCGYSVRRSCGHKRVLVVLVFEGALRVGMLIILIGTILRRS